MLEVDGADGITLATMKLAGASIASHGAPLRPSGAGNQQGSCSNYAENIYLAWGGQADADRALLGRYLDAGFAMLVSRCILG